MAVMKINGDIVNNELRGAYEYYGFECTTPSMVREALDALPEGDHLEIKINSGGGDVHAGQEIYSMLALRDDVEIEVESIAASAASLIAMAGPSKISPVGMLMIHDVSVCGASGNKNDMKKMAQTLAEYDDALANAYVIKTGMMKDMVLRLMDKETYMSAGRAVELGFIDEISTNEQYAATAIGGVQVTSEMVEQYEKAMADKKIAAEMQQEKDSILSDLDMYGV